MRDAALSPAAILGHHFTGAAMTVEIPYAVVLLVAVEAACIVVGALIGIGVTFVRVRGERRGQDR